MNALDVKPGDVVVTNCGAYQHWSIVSDRSCEQGHLMLISATKADNNVTEEPWQVATQGKSTYIANVNFTKPVAKVLRDARSLIGVWPYSPISNNCEHFVNWATNLEVKSTQVVAGVGGALAGAVLVGLLSEKPDSAKFLGGALLLGGLAVAGSKAAEKI